MVLFAFGVGLANFAAGRSMPPKAVIAAISQKLGVLASYGSTGNVAPEDGDLEEIHRKLETATGTAWAVVGAERLESGLRMLDAIPPPALSSNQERPTPGLAFAVTRARPGPLSSNERVILHRVSMDIVAVWKLDLLAGSVLDRDRRRGGWGAVSVDIGMQVGGRWTARSRRTLDGLRGRVEARPR